MSVVETDQQLAAIQQLAAQFITELEGRGFRRAQIANVMTGLGENLAAACNDPDALALVIEAALQEIESSRKPGNGATWHASDAAAAALRPARLPI